MKMLRNYLVAFLACCTFLMTDCATFMPDASYVDQYLLRASYEQEGCFGRCPVYRLSIYDNGLMVYEGKNFTDKEGTWQKLLTRTEFSELMEDMEAAGFPGFPQAFPSNTADIAAKRMVYFNKATRETFSTSWKESSTEKLEMVASRMRTLAERADYKMVSTDLRERRSNVLGTNRQVANQELIIQLIDGVNPEAWAVKFSQLNLQYKSKLMPRGSYFLFDADPNKAPINEQLDMIRMDEEVLGAQTNKEVSQRRD